MPLFIFSAQKMHIKSIKQNSIAMTLRNFDSKILARKILVYLFYSHFGIFMAIWYFLPRFGMLSLVVNPGANPTTSSYNASVVKFYNAPSSLDVLKTKYFLLLLKTL
jgi:hypothetical protein